MMTHCYVDDLEVSEVFSMRHPARAPDVRQLLGLLQQYGIRYVLAGSVAAQLHGVPVVPGDLDIVPALDVANLAQVAKLLHDLEASIDGDAGYWAIQPDGERKWIDVKLTSQEQNARAAAWRPLADDVTAFDHLYQTRCGNFDVVPAISGNYEFRMERAVAMKAYGISLWVAHVDDLLATLTVPRRKKDAERVQALRAIQRQ